MISKRMESFLQELTDFILALAQVYDRAPTPRSVDIAPQRDWRWTLVTRIYYEQNTYCVHYQKKKADKSALVFGHAICYCVFSEHI